MFKGRSLLISVFARLLNIKFIFLIGFGSVLTIYGIQPIQVASHFISHTLCSETFISGIPTEVAFRERIQPMKGMTFFAKLARYDVNSLTHEVKTSILGQKSRALYLANQGCVLIHTGGDINPVIQRELESLPSLQNQNLIQTSIGGHLKWPSSIVSPKNEGLRQAIDSAFVSLDSPFRRTKAMLVIHDGQIIGERYAIGYGIDTPILGWSMTKSVISALVGILIRDGKLVSPNQRIAMKNWNNPEDPRREITISHLLRMESGLNISETYSGFDPASRMLYLEPDAVSYIENSNLKAKPGTHWEYLSANTLILSKIIQNSVGGGIHDFSKFAREKLFLPIGMEKVFFEFDESGTPLGSSYMYATARDWGRFGMLYLNEGIIGGVRILPHGWVRYSSEAVQNGQVGYGAGFWTNLGNSQAAQQRIQWGMPSDSFFAAGVFGQRVIIIPSKKLVIVLLGVNHMSSQDLNRWISGLVGKILNSLS